MTNIIVLHIGWALVHSLWQITLLALLYHVIHRLIPIRYAKIRYSIGYMILLAMPILPLLTGFLAHSPETAHRQVTNTVNVKELETPDPLPDVDGLFDDFPVIEKSLLEEDDPLYGEFLNLLAQERLSEPTEDLAAMMGPILMETIMSTTSPEEMVTEQEARLPVSSTFLLGLLERCLTWSVYLWGIGVVFLSVRLFREGYSLRMLRKSATPIDGGEWFETLNALLARFRMKYKIPIAESLRINSPILLGIFRPMILLPISVRTGLTPQEIESILAHELAHIRHWDAPANFIQLIIETLLYYHPLVWSVSRSIRHDREYICDDFVVYRNKTDRIVYANALAHLEQIRHEFQGDHKMKTFLSTPAATAGQFFTRLQRILDVETPKTLKTQPHTRPLYRWAGLILIGTLITVGFYLNTSVNTPMQITSPMSPMVMVTEEQPAEQFVMGTPMQPGPQFTMGQPQAGMAQGPYMPPGMMGGPMPGQMGFGGMPMQPGEQFTMGQPQAGPMQPGSGMPQQQIYSLPGQAGMSMEMSEGGVVTRRQDGTMEITAPKVVVVPLGHLSGMYLPPGDVYRATIDFPAPPAGTVSSSFALDNFVSSFTELNHLIERLEATSEEVQAANIAFQFGKATPDKVGDAIRQREEFLREWGEFFDRTLKLVPSEQEPVSSGPIFPVQPLVFDGITHHLIESSKAMHMAMAAASQKDDMTQEQVSDVVAQNRATIRLYEETYVRILEKPTPVYSTAYLVYPARLQQDIVNYLIAGLKITNAKMEALLTAYQKGDISRDQVNNDAVQNRKIIRELGRLITLAQKLVLPEGVQRLEMGGMMETNSSAPVQVQGPGMLMMPPMQNPMPMQGPSMPGPGGMEGMPNMGMQPPESPYQQQDTEFDFSMSMLKASRADLLKATDSYQSGSIDKAEWDEVAQRYQNAVKNAQRQFDLMQEIPAQTDPARNFAVIFSLKGIFAASPGEDDKVSKLVEMLQKYITTNHPDVKLIFDSQNLVVIGSEQVHENVKSLLEMFGELVPSQHQPVGTEQVLPVGEPGVLTRPSPLAETQIKIFTVTNGDASSLLNTLQQVFSFQMLQATRNDKTPMRFSFDAGTNSVIATGSADELAAVEDLIRRLDEEKAKIDTARTVPQQQIIGGISHQFVPRRQDGGINVPLQQQFQPSRSPLVPLYEKGQSPDFENTAQALNKHIPDIITIEGNTLAEAVASVARLFPELYFEIEEKEYTKQEPAKIVNRVFGGGMNGVMLLETVVGPHGMTFYVNHQGHVLIGHTEEVKEKVQSGAGKFLRFLKSPYLSAPVSPMSEVAVQYQTTPPGLIREVPETKSTTMMPLAPQTPDVPVAPVIEEYPVTVMETRVVDGVATTVPRQVIERRIRQNPLVPVPSPQTPDVPVAPVIEEYPVTVMETRVVDGVTTTVPRQVIESRIRQNPLVPVPSPQTPVPVEPLQVWPAPTSAPAPVEPQPAPPVRVTSDPSWSQIEKTEELLEERLPEFNLQGVTLAEVVAEIAGRFPDLYFEIEESKLTLQQPVMLTQRQFKDVSAAVLLNRILRPMGMAYYINMDGDVLIADEEKARDLQLTRVYDLSGLVKNDDPASLQMVMIALSRVAQHAEVAVVSQHQQLLIVLADYKMHKEIRKLIAGLTRTASSETTFAPVDNPLRPLQPIFQYAPTR